MFLANQKEKNNMYSISYEVGPYYSYKYPSYLFIRPFKGAKTPFIAARGPPCIQLNLFCQNESPLVTPKGSEYGNLYMFILRFQNTSGGRQIKLLKQPWSSFNLNVWEGALAHHPTHRPFSSHLSCRCVPARFANAQGDVKIEPKAFWAAAFRTRKRHEPWVILVG